MDFSAWVSELCSNYILQSLQKNPLLRNDALVHDFGIESIHDILGKAEAKTTPVICMHQPKYLHPLALKPETKPKCNKWPQSNSQSSFATWSSCGWPNSSVTHSDFCSSFICAVGPLLNPLRGINVVDHRLLLLSLFLPLSFDCF